MNHNCPNDSYFEHSHLPCRKAPLPQLPAHVSVAGIRPMIFFGYFDGDHFVPLHICGTMNDAVCANANDSKCFIIMAVIWATCT